MTTGPFNRDFVAQNWGIAAIAFVGGLGGGVVFPILPIIGMGLGISGLMVGLILSANRIARLGFDPIVGGIIDHVGVRWSVAAGLAMEAAGTLAFSIGLRADIPSRWFLLGRVIWGVGSSLLLVGTLAGVMTTARPERRGSMTARVRAALGLGVPAGLVIGGLVADQVSADAAFLVATALTLGGAVAALFVLPPKAECADPGMDRERRGEHRLREWARVLWMPTLRMIWVVNALQFFAVSGVLLATLAVMVKQRQINVFGLGAEGSAGLYMALLMGSRAAAALAVGRHLDRTSSRRHLLSPTMLLMAAGFVILGQAHSVTAVLGSLLVIGAGAGGLNVPILTLLGDVTPMHLHGRTLAVYQWSGDLGGALGPAIGLELGHYLGFRFAYWMVGLALFLTSTPLHWVPGARN